MTANNLWSKIGLVVLSLLGLYLLVTNLPRLPDRTGKWDFQGYWSASYLLSQADNFVDGGRLLEVQRELAHWDATYPIRTWNPPWVLVWFLPYALLDFETAATLWLLTNILILFLSMIFSWRFYAAQSTVKQWFWLPIVAAVTFPSTIVALIFGQVNLLVLGGLVAFLVLYQRSHDFSAGLALSLLTVKPHLVYLTVPIILLSIWEGRRWRVLVGAATALIGSTAVVFILRPSFWTEYLAGTSGGNLLAWETATLTTYLSLELGWVWIRFLGVALLPLVVILWFYHKNNLSLATFVEITLLLSVITMPFGWSYDFVVLLLPLTHALFWMVDRRHASNRIETTLLISVIAGVYILYYQQRVQTPSELYFFWVPLAIGSIYAWIYNRYQYVTL